MKPGASAIAVGETAVVAVAVRSAAAKIILAGGLFSLVAILVIPVQSAILDMLLALNLALTVMLLLITLAAKQPLDFSVFPSVLLLLTLFRLTLNVSTSRAILLHGEAGDIVRAFGDYVVQGHLLVGLVVFGILVVIQFVVVTKGAGRISEVAARFILDAMPGKQMAIDAELNAGAIDEPEGDGGATICRVKPSSWAPGRDQQIRPAATPSPGSSSPASTWSAGSSWGPRAAWTWPAPCTPTRCSRSATAWSRKCRRS